MLRKNLDFFYFQLCNRIKYFCIQILLDAIHPLLRLCKWRCSFHVFLSKITYLASFRMLIIFSRIKWWMFFIKCSLSQVFLNEHDLLIFRNFRSFLKLSHIHMLTLFFFPSRNNDISCNFLHLTRFQKSEKGALYSRSNEFQRENISSLNIVMYTILFQTRMKKKRLN